MGTVYVFVAEVFVSVRVIGSSVSPPRFSNRWYSVTIPDDTTQLTNFLNVTAQSDASGNLTFSVQVIKNIIIVDRLEVSLITIVAQFSCSALVNKFTLC